MRRLARTAIVLVLLLGALPLAAAAGDDRAPEATRAAIAREAHGTYLEEMLHASDSTLVRWPGTRPVTVWIAEAPRLRGWTPAHRARVRAAFAAWRATGIPVRFTFVRDSAAAQLRVRWVDHFSSDRFPTPRTGNTTVRYTEQGWMLDGHVSLALRRPDGTPVDRVEAHAVALHEIGHALGLGHTRDTAAVMRPTVLVRELTAIDRATVRLLYRLHPGRVF